MNCKCEACGGTGRIVETVTHVVDRGTKWQRSAVEEVGTECLECNGFGYPEQWKEVASWAKYEVSNHGNVRRAAAGQGTHSGRVLQPSVSQLGYESVTLSNGDSRKEMLVHRLVAVAFVPNDCERSTVNHMDGVKRHNHARNLEWCSLSENVSHAYRTGLSKNCGQSHHKSSITEDQVREIREAHSNGESRSSLQNRFGLARTTLADILTGKTWKHLDQKAQA